MNVPVDVASPEAQAQVVTGVVQAESAALPRPGRCPLAQWRPLEVNYSRSGNQPRLFIVHMMQGTLEGTDSWFRNPRSEVSAHFGVGRDGTIYQWVDTEDIAWHAVAANPHSIGVEHEGYSGQPLTARQLDATGELLAWAHRQYPAIALWFNSRPDTGCGLSWHGLGGLEWGNHPACPGAPVLHQLPDLLAVAKSEAGMQS